MNGRFIAEKILTLIISLLVKCSFSIAIELTVVVDNKRAAENKTEKKDLISFIISSHCYS